MIGGPPGHLRHNTGKAQRYQVEFVNEDIDDADRIVLRHVVIQAGGKQCCLLAILALDGNASSQPPLIGNHFTKSARFHTIWTHLCHSTINFAVMHNAHS